MTSVHHDDGTDGLGFSSHGRRAGVTVRSIATANRSRRRLDYNSPSESKSRRFPNTSLAQSTDKQGECPED